MTCITYDLSEIFNENGYINKSDYGKYVENYSVTHIILTQSNDSPIKIGNGFLFGYVNLISIDISKIVNIIAIGNYFLYGCEKLTIFDVTKLTSLITIGDYFLCNCYELTIFDATELIKLTTIGDYFLYCCYNLINFNTTGLTSLKHIGSCFLLNCNENLTITVKNPPDCLYNKLYTYNFTIIQSYNKPIIYLVNNCVI